MTRILIVEDNDDMAFGVQRILEFEGYEVAVEVDGPAGLARFSAGDIDLMVLDLMLPGLSGFDILRELRAKGSRVPVLVLTARGAEEDLVMGFQSGADDYVTKPFSSVELIARVRALLRRSAPSAPPASRTAARTSFGNIVVDTTARTVSRAGENVALSPKEFDLLLALLRRNGEIASRAELLKEVWRYPNSGIATRTVDIHIAELRRKLEEDAARPQYILTARKAGYRLTG